MSNSLPQKQLPFSVAISTESYRTLIKNTLRDEKRANRFVTAITSAVATNPALAECSPSTILAGALVGESLGLLPSPALGQFYLIPYKTKAKYDKQGSLISPEGFSAQFQIGYKGLIQLALRTGAYRRLNAIAVKEGEFGGYDPFTEDLTLHLFDDPAKRESLPTVGYAAMFEYLNGFRKVMYWTREQMMIHADRYSPAFTKDAIDDPNPNKSRVSYEDYLKGNYDKKKDGWKYSSFWYTDFDAMAKKTMLRQIISHWGVMSSELADAFERDDSVLDVSDGAIVSEQPKIAEQPALPKISQPEQPASPEPETISFDEI